MEVDHFSKRKKAPRQMKRLPLALNPSILQMFTGTTFNPHQALQNASDDTTAEDLACLAYVSNALDPITCLKYSDMCRLVAAGDLRYDPIF